MSIEGNMLSVDYNPTKFPSNKFLSKSQSFRLVPALKSQILYFPFTSRPVNSQSTFSVYVNTFLYVNSFDQWFCAQPLNDMLWKKSTKFVKCWLILVENMFASTLICRYFNWPLCKADALHWHRDISRTATRLTMYQNGQQEHLLDWPLVKETFKLYKMYSCRPNLYFFAINSRVNQLFSLPNC